MEKPVLILIKETASLTDVIFVLNSLNMITKNEDFIEKLKDNGNFHLKEVEDGKRQAV